MTSPYHQDQQRVSVAGPGGTVLPMLLFDPAVPHVRGAGRVRGYCP